MLSRAIIKLFGNQASLRLLASSTSNHVQEVAVQLVSRPSAVKSLVAAARSTLQRAIDGSVRQTTSKIQAGNLQYSGHISKNSLLPQTSQGNRFGNILKWSVYFNNFQRLSMNTRAHAFSSALRGKSRLGIVSFALLGFTLVDSEVDEHLKPTIEDCVQLYRSKFVSESKETLSDNSYSSRLDDYVIKERLGQPSSCAAVYAATCEGKECALKMIFNYDTPSNSAALMQRFRDEFELLLPDGSSALPPHPNIIKVHNAFADDTPVLYDGDNSYPAAIPRRHNKEGFGRNRTIFMTMPKLSCTLNDYIASMGPLLDDKQRTMILLQLFQGIGHLERHNVVHRDLKADNVLIDTCAAQAKVVITDFGCCLNERKDDMILPFHTFQTNRGGNTALMPPEIFCAEPGPYVDLDYSKADIWSGATLAYEIFGERNPFYHDLLNENYSDNDLPAINCSILGIQEVILACLHRDPSQRISACQAATALFVLLNAPHHVMQMDMDRIDGAKVVNRWLLALSLAVAAHDTQKKKEWNDSLQASKIFLSTVTSYEVLEAIAFLQKEV